MTSVSETSFKIFSGITGSSPASITGKIEGYFGGSKIGEINLPTWYDYHCYVEGSLVILSNGETIKVEDVNYDHKLFV